MGWDGMTARSAAVFIHRRERRLQHFACNGAAVSLEHVGAFRVRSSTHNPTQKNSGASSRGSRAHSSWIIFGNFWASLITSFNIWIMIEYTLATGECCLSYLPCRAVPCCAVSHCRRFDSIASLGTAASACAGRAHGGAGACV